jgi:superfamily I DNA/RNA helicase
MNETIRAEAVVSVFEAILSLLNYPHQTEFQVAFWDQIVRLNLAPVDEDQALRDWLSLNPLLMSDPMQLHHVWLLQRYFDLMDWSRRIAEGSVSRVLLDVTETLFRDSDLRSLGYMIAKTVEQNIRGGVVDSGFLGHPLEQAIAQLGRLKRHRNLSRMLQENPAGQGGLSIQVMTLHKAKGQEFDAVLMPELSKKSYPDDFSALRKHEGQWVKDQLVLSLNRIKQTPLTKEDLQRQRLQEEARLLYVGLTRAKRALWLSCSQKIQHPKSKYASQNPATSVFKVVQDFVSVGA